MSTTNHVTNNTVTVKSCTPHTTLVLSFVKSQILKLLEFQ